MFLLCLHPDPKRSEYGTHGNSVLDQRALAIFLDLWDYIRIRDCVEGVPKLRTQKEERES